MSSEKPSVLPELGFPIGRPSDESRLAADVNGDGSIDFDSEITALIHVRT